jgi:hypothetical protein
VKRVIGIALLAGGIVLLVLGFQSKDSLESRWNQFINGSPNHKTTWFLVGGAACSAAGVALILLKDK